MSRRKTDPADDNIASPFDLTQKFKVHKDMNTHDLISACKAACIDDSQGEAYVIGKDALTRLLDNAA